MSDQHSDTAKHAVGIDFGGTSIKMGLVDEQGRIHARITRSTKQISSPPVWMNAVEKGLHKLQKKGRELGSEFAGLGVGVPGLVDVERGYIHDLPNVAGWEGVFPRDDVRGWFGCANSC